MRTILSAFLVIFLLSAPAISDDGKQQQTYQAVVGAIKSGDIPALRSYLNLQPGLTFEAVEKNWPNAQKMFQKIYWPLEEATMVENATDKNGATYWILENNAATQGSKQLKAFKFMPDPTSPTGLKLLATPYFASYTFPDNTGNKAWVIEDIKKKILAE